MKKLSFLLLFIILIMVNASAQNIPRGMKYQAVARDLKGEVLSNAKIELRINLLSKTDATQSSHYSEIHSVVTNQLGLFTLVVGEGKMETGDFEKVPWSSADIWMEIQIKTNGQSDFTSISNSQLLAVPYAYYAATAGVLAGAILQGNTANKGFHNPRCPCEGGLSQIKVLYLGPTNVTINVYRNKNLTELLRTFTGVTSGSILEINAVNFPDGKLKNDTYFQVMSPNIAVVEIPTECEEFKEPWEFSLGETFGNFSVLSHRDRKNGNECTVCDIRKEWQVGGNGLMDLCNMLGTKSNTDLIFITNNLERLKITKDGGISITNNLEIGEDLFVKKNVHLNTVSGSTTNNGPLTVANMSPTNLTGTLTVAKVTNLNDPTESTSITSGALVVTGGAGIGKRLNVGGMTKVNDGTESTTITDGALVVTGGAGIGKRLNVGGITKINDGTESSTTANGALVVTGGAGIGKQLNVGGIIKVNDGTESNNTAEGALVVTGGAGIGKRLNVGGALNVNGTSTLVGALNVNSTSTLSGALTVNNTSALNGQVTVKATLPLGEDTYNNYPLRVEGSPQGIAIKLSAPTPNESNNYLTLFNNGGDIKGRIEGQTALTGIARNIVTAIVTEPGLDDAFDFSQDKNQAPTSTPPTMAQYFGSNYAFAALSLTLDFVTDIVRFVVNVLGASGACVTGDCDDVVWSVIDAVIGGIQLAAYVAMQEFNLGIAFESGGADYAEWLPKENVEETFIFGDVVGVKGGSISKKFKDAERFMVVSRSPVIIGGMPEINKESFFEKIAFMGQVPVKVTGEVHKGDYILPSGNADGMAIAVKPGKMMASDFKRIIGIAWAESDNSKIINYINTAVGINSNDMAGMIEQMQLVMNNMQKALVAVAPTYKPNYYTIGKDVEVNSNSYTTSPTLNEKFRKEIGGMAKYSNLNEAMQVAKNYAVNQGFDLKQYPMLENLLDNPTPENAQKALDHYTKSLAKAQKLMKQFEEYRKQN